MEMATAGRSKMRRSKERRQGDESVKIAPDVVKLARAIAIYRGTSIAAYLSEVLRPIVLADHAVELKKLAASEPASPKPEGPRRPK